jgi:hypothetical protein
MIKVVKIDLNDKVYGGRVYENEIIKQLDGEVKFKREFMMPYSSMIRNILHVIYLFIKYKFFYTGTLLLTNSTTYFAGWRSRNIVIVHHIDSRFSFKLKVLYDFLCDEYLFFHKRRFNTVVTVAKLWHDKLIKSGFHNVKIVYNSFDSADYQFSEDEKRGFRKKYNLDGKPIVYLGNCRIGKGVVESYEALKSLDVNFVTSGVANVSLPIPNLFLPLHEYKLLLAASDIVIAMSTFKEGWNRTVHETSLCGTHVVGSGIAGMGELLDIADQTKATSFEQLPQIVKRILSMPKYRPTEKLKSLNLTYFKNEWLKILG